MIKQGENLIGFQISFLVHNNPSGNLSMDVSITGGPYIRSLHKDEDFQQITWEDFIKDAELVAIARFTDDDGLNIGGLQFDDVNDFLPGNVKRYLSVSYNFSPSNPLPDLNSIDMLLDNKRYGSYNLLDVKDH